MTQDNGQDNAPLQPNNDEGQNQPKSDPSDQLTPEHPRFKEVIAQNHELKDQIGDLQSQLKDVQDSINRRQEETGDDELTAEEEKSLDRIQKGLKTKYNVVTQEDLRVERRARTYDKLSDKYDGENGLPKFVPVDVEAHAKANGYGDNLEAAYKDMHFQAFVQAEAKKTGTKITPPTSEKPTGGDRDQIANTEFTPEAVAAMSDEEYEKNRDKILGGIKSSIQ